MPHSVYPLRSVQKGSFCFSREIFRSGSFQADCDEVGNTLQHGLRHSRSADSHTRDWLRAAADADDQIRWERLYGTSVRRGSTVELLVQPFRRGSPDRIDLGGVRSYKTTPSTLKISDSCSMSCFAIGALLSVNKMSRLNV